MSEWQPIETCPENTWVMVYAPWEDQSYRISKFRWGTVHKWEVVSETTHASGKRRISEERHEKFRDWDGSAGDWWVPLPEAPND